MTRTATVPQDLPATLFACPSCKSARLKEAPEEIVCMQCGTGYAIVDGIRDLRTDRAMDTQLDLETYDEHHNVDSKASLQTFQIYDRAFNINPSGKSGKILEIGSGTGNLTIALARHGRFSEIHCSDISLRFMQRLVHKIGDADKLHRYLFDANNMPFQDNTFDFVAGHSILHHLIDFERTIQDSFRVLKKGGVAIFGEPMIETNALVYLAADQILRVDGLLPESKLSPITRTVLQRVGTWGELVMTNLRTRGEPAPSMEDKFIFPAEYMREVARKAGFSDYAVMQYAPVANLREVVYKQLQRILRGTNAVVSEIEFFLPLMESFEISYHKSMAHYTSQTFAFNIFVK